MLNSKVVPTKPTRIVFNKGWRKSNRDDIQKFVLKVNAAVSVATDIPLEALTRGVKLNSHYGNGVRQKLNRDVLYAVYVSMFIVRRFSTFSLIKIGNVFGKRNHGTCVYAVKRISGELEMYQKVRCIVNTALFHLGFEQVKKQEEDVFNASIE